MKVQFTFNARRRLQHIEDYHTERGATAKEAGPQSYRYCSGVWNWKLTQS